jgi:hypothetical protein
MIAQAERHIEDVRSAFLAHRASHSLKQFTHAGD